VVIKLEWINDIQTRLLEEEECLKQLRYTSEGFGDLWNSWITGVNYAA
jgi:hypothetical protein